MELKLINAAGVDAGVLTVSDQVFAKEYNEALVHQVVTAFLANSRQATRAQKNRASVAHSTKKPWRQKGTGRARAGMSSSPVWRGGGRAFPNSPEENYTQKVNRKMYRSGISVILSKLLTDGRLIVTENMEVDLPKTKSLVNMLKDMQLANQTILVVVNELTENLYYASRNLPNVLVLEAHQIDPYSLLRCDKVLLTKQVVELLEEQYSC